MIPKIIHAVWVGKGVQNQVIQLCIASWKEKMPDYEIMMWDESNVDIKSLPPFAQHMYQNKRWAYVADVIRFEKLYEYGGVFLDTDMLMLRDPTPLFSHRSDDISIWGYEDETHISCGIIACNKGNKLMRELYQFYIDHYKNNNMNLVIEVPRIVTDTINNNPREYIIGQNIIVYPREYFYALPNANKKEDYRKFLTKHSYAVHLWNYSWQTPFMKVMNKLQIVKISKKIIPKSLKPKIVNLLRRLKLN